MPTCIIHIDGGSRGNPGPAGVGVMLQWDDQDAPFHEAGYFLGEATNNFAEYQGLLKALDVAFAAEARTLEINSDSQLLVRQLLGQYRVKSPNIKPLYQQAVDSLKRFEQWNINHIYRDKNKRADQLANMAMDAIDDIIVIENGQEM